MSCLRFTSISSFNKLCMTWSTHLKLTQCNTTAGRYFNLMCSGRLLANDSTMSHKYVRNKNKKGEASSLRHVKYQNQREGKMDPPGSIEVQVVGAGYPGTPRAFIINMNHFKYLFNCGEGTQRITMEHRMKISKIQEVFFTKHSWENIAGLLGMCLSLESMDVPLLRLHGPQDVEKIVTMSKGFAQLHRIRIEKCEVDQGCYRDSAMQINYIPLFPQRTSGEPALKKQKFSSMVVAYLCKPHAKGRSVSLEKCVDLGIQRGPIIGQLKKGEEVTLPNGKLIKPDDILSDPEPNHPFLVLECPSLEYVQSILSSDMIQNASPGLIVHMTPHQVLQDPAYQSWIRGCPDHTKHLVLNDRCSGVVYEGVYRIQSMLNMVHPGIFPELPEPHIPIENDSESSPNVVSGETNLKFNIRSKTPGFTRDSCINLDPEAFRKTATDQSEFREILEKVKVKLKAQTASDAAPYPEILFLGTGSAIPNKVRNVSAIWLNLSEDQSILLDCGENTLGQMMRHYGDKVDDMLVKLAAIFVSHLHADHHLGIISVVRERNRVLMDRGQVVTPLDIISSSRLSNWYQNLDDPDIDMVTSTRIIPVESCYRYPPGGRTDEYNELVKRLDMKEIELVRVLHRQFPHGVILTHTSGWKLVYSGDTMPCENLVKSGQDCDLLIHEATMEDDLEEDAKVKRHSTTSQAIQVGLDMKAKFILLTHFSQRYAKVPLFNDNFSSRVGIAFDNMRVRLSEMPLIPHILPALKAMFAEDYASMEERTLKRSYRKEQDAASGRQQGGKASIDGQGKGEPAARGDGAGAAGGKRGQAQSDNKVQLNS